MKRDFDFSEEDSEKFILEFKSVTTGPMAEVASALRSLSNTQPLPTKAKPKVLPSQISIKSSHKFRFFGGGVVTGVATVGAAAGLALGAAAVTGNMPPLISETAKKVAHVISSALTSDPVAPTSQEVPMEEATREPELSGSSSVTENAPEKINNPQKTETKVEVQQVQPQPAAQSVPANPQPLPLAQPDAPVIAQHDDGDDDFDEENNQSSEKTENQKTEKSSPQNSNEQKQSDEKDSEKKDDSMKEDKDDQGEEKEQEDD